MLGSMVAGRYSATWDAVDIGFSRTGLELDFQFKQEVIDETDLYGMTTIDMIMRGADVHLSATLREWKTGSKALLWAIGGGVLGKIFSAAVPCGSFASDLASALVMTGTAGTTAQATLATLTGSKAFPAANFNPKILFDSRLREIPMRLILFPYASGSDLVAFSTT